MCTWHVSCQWCHTKKIHADHVRLTSSKHTRSLISKGSFKYVVFILISQLFLFLFLFSSCCCLFFFSRLCNQSRDRFGVSTINLRRTKIKRNLISIGKETNNADIIMSRLVNLSDQVERAVHKVRRLQYKIGKTVTGQVKGEVPDTSFLIDRSSLPGPWV